MSDDSARQQTRKVRANLRIYAALSAALFLTAAAFTYFSWTREASRHERQLESVVALSAQGISTYFITLEKLIAELGDQMKAEGLGPGSAARLKAFKARYSEFSIVVAIDLDGKFLYTSEENNKGGARAAGVSNDPSFIEFRKRLSTVRGLEVSRTVHGPLTGQWITPLRYVVRDDHGEPLFILTAGLPQNRAHAFWKDVPLSTGAGIALLRDDAYLVSRFPPLDSKSGKEFTEPHSISAAGVLASRGFPDQGTYTAMGKLSQTETLGAFKRLPSLPLTLIAVEPTANLTRDWLYGAMPIYVMLALLFTGAVFGLRWKDRHEAMVQAERLQQIEKLELGAAMLTQSNQSLQTSNRKKEALNAELEAFVYTVSHDLRAPLRAINGFAELLQAEMAQDIRPTEQTYLSNIKRNSSRMALLLNDLLDLSKYSVVDIHHQMVDMNEMVRDVIQELNIDLTRVDIDTGELPGRSCDPSLIRQVWSNLISNAVKYSARSQTPKVKISFTESRYTVSDNGAGFDMSYRDKLFKLFSRLHSDKDYEGTGVGLAIVKRIVERHDGVVYANSVLGSGSTFGFSLG